MDDFVIQGYNEWKRQAAFEKRVTSQTIEFTLCFFQGFLNASKVCHFSVVDNLWDTNLSETSMSNVNRSRPPSVREWNPLYARPHGVGDHEYSEETLRYKIIAVQLLKPVSYLSTLEKRNI